jgi:osmotically-inducible protein OsmY
LSGHVDSYSEKWGAERAVKRVSGTRAVVIELDVKIKNSAKRSDADIALSAVNRMQWQANIPNDAIHVSVEKGVITLTGDVAWRYQRDAAYEAVRNLTGAVGVINQILIKPKVNTVAIKGDIEAALKRHASLEAQKISVLLDGDKVTLTGKVPTWSEKHLAFNAAWNSPGVRSVLDELVVG